MTGERSVNLRDFQQQLGYSFSNIDLLDNALIHRSFVNEKLRAYVVNEQSLAGIARRLHIGDYLLLGRGEEGSGGRTKTSILSNTFEAVAAAVYLDCGFEKTYKFLENIFEPLAEEGIKSVIYKDYKTALQETGPDHDKVFEINLTIAGMITTTGTGKSKKEAEQQAARRALEEFAKLRDTASPLNGEFD